MRQRVETKSLKASRNQGIEEHPTRRKVDISSEEAGRAASAQDESRETGDRRERGKQPDKMRGLRRLGGKSGKRGEILVAEGLAGHTGRPFETHDSDVRYGLTQRHDNLPYPEPYRLAAIRIAPVAI
ncbi:hypothetical protein J2Y55_002695 [Bosea sp. BE125]|uniref:hypothetical protein n=1 Tax=Bosea sp. BE125 TaxID=2817909 RepID=UPI0028615449|nr:hypothetical protein [Bosea sp. BE125]MDR6871682.1 hypothetical protein [Bosea sp. BE125]